MPGQAASPGKSSKGRAKAQKNVSFSNLNNLIDDRERDGKTSARNRSKSPSPEKGPYNSRLGLKKLPWNKAQRYNEYGIS